MACKKYLLKERKELQNIIACSMFMVAGLTASSAYLATHGFQIETNPEFWYSIIPTGLLGALSMFFIYKALSVAELSHVMPFFSITTLFLVVPSMIFLKEIPSLPGLIGIAILVAGAVFMGYKKGEDSITKDNKKGLMYFLIALVLVIFIPIGLKLAINANTVGNPSAYTSFSYLLSVSLFFIPFIFVFKENRIFKAVMERTRGTKFSSIILLGGVTMAIEFIAMNRAFELTDVAYVMAIKRTMPFFAFLIGYLIFKERADVKRKLLATTLMVAGTILIILLG
jgi:uncharacterized membrane protein